MLVVGAPSSSNSNRLVEVARVRGARAELVEDAREHRPGLARGCDTRRRHRRRVDAGDAGAAPCASGSASLGASRTSRRCPTVDEGVRFALPAELQAASSGARRPRSGPAPPHAGRRPRARRGPSAARSRRSAVPSPRARARSSSPRRRSPTSRRTRERWLPELLLSARPGYGAECLGELAAPLPRDAAAAPLAPELAPDAARGCMGVERLPGTTSAPPSELERGAAPARRPRRRRRRRSSRTGPRFGSQSTKGCSGSPRATCAGARSRRASPSSRASPTAASRPRSRARPAKRRAPRPRCSRSASSAAASSTSPPTSTCCSSTRRRPTSGDPVELAPLVELIRCFKKHLEVPSEDGFGYRVDLDLRPEGRDRR